MIPMPVVVAACVITLRIPVPVINRRRRNVNARIDPRRHIRDIRSRLNIGIGGCGTNVNGGSHGYSDHNSSIGLGSGCANENRRDCQCKK